MYLQGTYGFSNTIERIEVVPERRTNGEPLPCSIWLLGGHLTMASHRIELVVCGHFTSEIGDSPSGLGEGEKRSHVGRSSYLRIPQKARGPPVSWGGRCPLPSRDSRWVRRSSLSEGCWFNDYQPPNQWGQGTFHVREERADLRNAHWKIL